MNSDENILKTIKYHSKIKFTYTFLLNLIYKINSFLVSSVFAKEIQDEIKLEEKYKLNHTEEELKHRKELQSKFRGNNTTERRKFLNAFWISFRWVRKNYLNFSSKNSFEEYDYAKHVLAGYSKLIFYGCLNGCGYTLLLYFWMRLLKHKGRKDKYYLFGMNFFMSLMFISNCI